MKKLPCIKAVAPETERTRRLRQWLRERSVDLALRDDPEEAEPAAPGAFLEAGPPAAAGQVRLMHPQAEATSARLCYLAVLREARPGLFLAAPFSRFSVPALPGEWRTPRSESPLRVLCLWNARLLPAASLGRSWFVDELPGPEASEALAVFDALKGGAAMSAGGADRTGPPVIHPLDPRHEYRDEERAWMDGVAASFFEQAGAGGEFPAVQPDELPLAAEPRKPYKMPGRKGKRGKS
ncbi:MAG: hypothetical protein KA248_15140 [Kiritimatiellae bacterium]|nr:hypothetical protein [Kiritimatiellia bacterium]